MSKIVEFNSQVHGKEICFKPNEHITIVTGMNCSGKSKLLYDLKYNRYDDNGDNISQDVLYLNNGFVIVGSFDFIGLHKNNILSSLLFIDVINSFTKDINLIFYHNEIGELKYRSNHKNENCGFHDSGNGVNRLINIIYACIFKHHLYDVFLFDDIEIGLHITWQEKLLETISNLLPNKQIIVTSHSPAIAMNGYLDCLIDMKNMAV